MFSFHFTQKKLGFGLSFCRMKLNTMQNFWQKVSILHFGFWPQEIKKKSKKTLTHPMKNLTFWMELNTPIKFLAFCISSFQSSWHFAFCILWGTKHSLSINMKNGAILSNFMNEIMI
jgi:hypothetical protein